MTSQESWEQIAASKHKEREDRIPAGWRFDVAPYKKTRNVLHVPKECGILSEREYHITSDFDATALLPKLADGSFSAEVAVAFCKRAAIAQQLTNCLTEIFFEDAIARARQLDQERLSDSTKTLRPFHGLPISLKDGYKIPGLDSTLGLTGLAYQPATEYSAMPALLLDLGAVLYCKTNIPQTLMSADSVNMIFGRTLNPNNTDLTAGGSSGGEGALVAMRGSLLGVGTDVGGSIRIPSAACGTYGFKGTVGTMPYGGQQVTTDRPGLFVIRPTAGPLATSMRDCRLFTQTVMQAEPWKYDSTVTHLPWTNRAVKPVNDLRIGIIPHDQTLTPHPPVRRTFESSVEKLQSAGVTCVPVSIPDSLVYWEGWARMFAYPGANYLRGLIDATGEPFTSIVKKLNLFNIPQPTLDEQATLTNLRFKGIATFHKIFLDNKLDALLMPPAANTALPHDEWTEVRYMAMWNYLDFPACFMPVDRVRDSDAPDDISHATFGEADQTNYKKYTGPQDLADAPTGIQIVGYSRMEESLVHVAETLDGIVNAK